MEPKYKIISIVTEIITLLELSNEKFWLSYFRQIEKEYLAGQDEKKICNSILKIYQGGMGSLNDLVLHKDGKPLIEENDKFDSLKDKLFHYCKKRVMN